VVVVVVVLQMYKCELDEHEEEELVEGEMVEQTQEEEVVDEAPLVETGQQVEMEVQA